MNPIWMHLIKNAISKVEKRCPHCGKKATYARKEPGHFYTCKSCNHRFKEKGK